MKIPSIKGGWQVLIRAEKCGNYVNDHTLFRDANGWRLIGITSKGGGPPMERYFINASGSSLTQQFSERGAIIDTGTLSWAPCVIKEKNLYFMYYGPSPTKMAVSVDATEWMGYEIKLSAPFLACHRDHYVIKTGESEWLMYAAGITTEGLSSISCLKSTDLYNWSFCSYALRCGENAPLKTPWGALESPVVIKRDGLYYLFVTYTDSGDKTYSDTLVFVSENPLDFGEYNANGSGAVPVAKLFAHAGEVICENGKTYITTCGWPEKPIPNPGCVSIAELEWVEGE